MAGDIVRNIKLIYEARTASEYMTDYAGNVSAVSGDSIRYILDFGRIATAFSSEVPLGIQRIDVSGPTRKTVQQTRAGSYVDAWDIGPNTIAIGGIVGIPEGLQRDVLRSEKYSGKTAGSVTDIPALGESADKKTNKANSVIGLINRFYYANSNSENLSKGHRLLYVDEFNQEIEVTMVSRLISTSVESGFMANFQIQLLTLNSQFMSDEVMASKFAAV